MGVNLKKVNIHLEFVTERSNIESIDLYPSGDDIV